MAHQKILVAIAFSLTLGACAEAGKDQASSGKMSANNESRDAKETKGQKLRSNIALACNCNSAGLKSEELDETVDSAVGDDVAITSGPGFATEDVCSEDLGSECAPLRLDFTPGNGFVCTSDQLERVQAKYDAEYAASSGDWSASVAAGEREIEVIREEFRNSAEAQNCR